MENIMNAWHKEFLEHAREVILYIDSEGRFLYVNQSCLSTLKYTDEEIASITLWDILHSDSIIHFRAVFEQNLQGKCTDEIELTFITKDGTQVLVKGNIRLKLDKKGRPVHTYCTFRDVTEHKQLKTSLRGVEAERKALLEAIPDLMFLFNKEGYLVDYKANNHENLLLEPEKFIGKHVHEALPPYLAKLTLRRLSQLFENKKSQLYEYPLEIDSEQKLFESRLVPCGDDRALAIVRDITESKRAENINRLMFDISNAVITVQNLDELYQSIHAALGKVIDVTNFFIAIVDMQKRTLYFPYHVDLKDNNFPPIKNFDPEYTLTGLVVSKRRPILYKKEELEKQAKKGGIWGPVPLIWMGTPLMIEDEIIGIVAVQSYTDPNLYTKQDLRILSAVSDQMASAIARKKIEEELLALKNFNEHIVQNIQEGIVITDKKGMITFANRALLDTLDYKIDEVTGIHWTSFVPEEQHALAREADERRSKGLTDRYELTLINKNGKHVPMQISGSPNYDHKTGEMIGTIAVFTDLSDIKKAQELITASEERLRLMARNIQDVVLETDANGYYTYVSESSEPVLGYSSKEMLGQRSLDFIHPDDAGKAAMTFIATIESGTVARMEYRYKHQKRGYIWVEGVGRAYNNSSNETMILITVRDITERKKAEETLLAEQNEKTLILDNLAEQIAFIDPEMRIIWANSKVIERHNLHNTDFRGHKCYEIYHGFDQPCPDCKVVVALETGETASGIHKSPDNCYWQMIGIPVHDQNGTLVGVMDSALEITDLVESKEALKESEKKYREILSAMEEGYYEVDLAGNLVFFNESFCRMTGYSSNELSGKNYKDFYINHEEIYKAFSQVYQTGKPVKAADWPAITKDNHNTHLEFSIALRHDESGKPIGFSGVIRDITTRREADEKIRYLSFHDQLTGLYNRHFLETEMSRLNTERQLPISIIMADLNGLKLVNDTYGHSHGDEMLIKAASILKTVCRMDDLLARFGGDEFLIYLPRTSEKEAQKVCLRIEKACQNELVNDVPLSLSTGLAVKTIPEQEIAELLREAEDNMYRNKLTESRSGKSAIVNSLLQTLAAKSFETETHTRNMQEAASKIGDKLGLPHSELQRLQLLITLHDIGKINIPEELLIKKEPLSANEWEIMKQHSETGYRIAKATENFAHVAEDILAHHERWNGNGYPHGLKEDQIPLLARITAIVDAYEVMSNGRSYKKAMSSSEIVSEFKRCSGSHFDPKLVELFLELIEQDN